MVNHLLTCPIFVTNTGTLQLQESSMRVITLAFNVIARYPSEFLQPYIGVGAGAFYFKGTDQFNAGQVVPGLNAQAGLKVLVTKEWGLFVEGKYNLATLDSFGSNFGVSGQYSVINGVGGIAYHF